MKRFQVLAVFASLLFVSAAALSQPKTPNIIVNKVTPPNGNSFGHITGIAQDKAGYMWFSSKKGLLRYDGYQFISYKKDLLAPNSISTDSLEAICIDNNGNIWLATLGHGLEKFDPLTQKFTHFRHSPNDTTTINADWISTLLKDRNGNIWVGSGNGLDKLDPVTGAIVHYRHDSANANSLSSNVVVSIYEDRNGTLWVGTGSVYGNDKENPNEGGLNRMNPDGTFTRYKHDPSNRHSLISNKVKAIFESRDGTFWIGTAGDGLHTMNRTTGEFQRHTYDPKDTNKLSRPPLANDDVFAHITFITEDVRGGIWIGTTDAGINYYDTLSKRVTHFKSTREYNDNNAWAAYSSREGMLWVSSFFGSLYRINPLRISIPLINANEEINTFYEDNDGSVWVATNRSGLIKYDSNNKVVKQYLHDGADANSLSGNSVQVITADRENNLWLGVFGSGLDQLDKQRKHFKHFKFDPSDETSLSNDMVISIYEDSQGDIWAGTFNGLNRLNKKTGKFSRYYFYPRNNMPFGPNIVPSITEQRPDLYWVSSWNAGGVHALNPQNGKFQTYLKGTSIIRIFKDHVGKIWAGGVEGLFYYDSVANEFVRFTDPLGVTEVSDIRGLFEDKKGNLWLSTSNRLFKINAQRDLVITFGSYFGLNFEMGYGQLHLGKSGKLYVGAYSGYYAFSPERITEGIKAPEIILSNFQLAGQPKLSEKNALLTTLLTNLEKITLDHDQNVFSIDFAGIDYMNPEENRHLFMLENYDRNWNLAGSERRAIYFNVPPGNYIFRVRAVNSYGVWSEKAVNVEIIPPWWSRWWFIVLVVIAGIVAIYGLVRWRLNEYRLRMDRAEKETQLSLLQHKAAQLEMHALRAQMNPHFLFNSLNSINRFILQNNSEQASQYLTKFSRLMRLILQNSQSELIPLENELEALRLYLELEAVRFDHHFSYVVQVDPEVDVSALKVPPLIIQPYVENAIWHGLMHKEEKGHLTVKLFQEEEFLICSITDDGIGRKKAAELKSKSASTHKSMGMKITADRIAIMKSSKAGDNHIQITDLVLPDGQPAGTRVELKIPLRYD
jgi:ligand-binding sensor domain-containing protein